MNQDKTPLPRERRAENSRHPINNALRVRTLLLVAVFILFGMGLLIYQLYALQLRDPERYRRQLREYADLLRGMGYDRTEGYLWYVKLGTIEKVV